MEVTYINQDCLQNVWHRPLLYVSYLPIQVLKTSLVISVLLPGKQAEPPTFCTKNKCLRKIRSEFFGEITYRIIFSHTSDLLIIICSGQGLQSVWIKFTTSRIKLLPVILGQFGSEGINGDDKCPTICLKGQNLAHDFLKMPNIWINVDNKCPSICLKGQNLAHDFLKMPNIWINGDVKSEPFNLPLRPKFGRWLPKMPNIWINGMPFDQSQRPKFGTWLPKIPNLINIWQLFNVATYAIMAKQYILQRPHLAHDFLKIPNISCLINIPFI